MPPVTPFATGALLLALLGGVMPASAAAAVPTAQTNASFKSWSDKFTEDWVRLQPEDATAAQYFSGAEQDALDRQLSPITEAQRARLEALARAGVRQLDVYLAEPLDADQRISAGTMRWSLQKDIEGAPFKDHRFVFNQMTGMHVALVDLLTRTHPMRRAADVDSYLARLDQVGLRIDESIARGRAAAARGVLPPQIILERALGQVAIFLQPAAAENVFVTSLATRSAKLADLTPEARTAAIARATQVVNDSVLPAYRRAAAFMAEIKPRAPTVVGLAALPQGSAAYAHYLALFTSTSMTAAQIHAIGLREVARIEAEMDGHLRTLGFKEGSVKERMAQLETSLQPPASPDPRPALMARYAAAVRDGEQRSRALFNLTPRALVEVQREPVMTEQTMAPNYRSPAPDGSRPGIFSVPLPGAPYEITAIRTTSYHEAVPGHHFQLALMQEQTALPKFRSSRIFSGGSAHAEGWALYAEVLALENGWYAGDLPGQLGALSWQLFRARRLVIDTGLHEMGWTREQAIAYGMSAQEVERYIGFPGQATAYMIGMLRIVELREQARRQLGPAFSLPAFHDVVLKAGSVPLEVLTEVVERWVAEVGAAPRQSAAGERLR